MMHNRYVQAKRTVCIETLPEASDDLLEMCRKFGSIHSVHPHIVNGNKYFLVEYNTVDEVQHLLAAIDYAEDISDGKSPLKSRFLTFKPNLRMIGKSPKKPTHPKFTEDRFKPAPTRVDYLKALNADMSIDEQIQELSDTNKLSDLSSRLRFLTALQIEEAVSGIFANMRVIPFGSSVNGFGRMSSDLDMMLISEQQQKQHIDSHLFVSRTKYQRDFEARDFARMTLNPLHVIMQQWLIGIGKTQMISAARIPIIGFEHRITDLECDLSTANM